MIAASTSAPARNNRRLSFGFASPFGGSSKGSSSVTRGTVVAFSSPTSISMLIVPSLRVHLFHLTDGPCQIRPRLVEAIQRCDLVVVCARQRILRLDHFDVVGHPGLQTVALLVHLLG